MEQQRSPITSAFLAIRAPRADGETLGAFVMLSWLGKHKQTARYTATRGSEWTANHQQMYLPGVVLPLTIARCWSCIVRMQEAPPDTAWECSSIS
jgi:hypothetical protein